MENNRVFKFFGRLIILSFVLGIVEFLFSLILIFNSIGDEAPKSSQVGTNELIIKFIGFPIASFTEVTNDEVFLSKFHIFNVIIKVALALVLFQAIKSFRKITKNS